MIIYVKEVLSNIGENAMDLGIYRSVIAEIWFGDRFWGDTKNLCVILDPGFT